GIMGRYYALKDGEKAEVADAIRDHYKPLGPNDIAPSAPISAALALTDKLDTLYWFFFFKQRPTGSKDPFALRRAALGVIRIIIENGFQIPLRGALDPISKVNMQVFSSEAERTETIQSLLEFIADRLKVYLRDRGARHDLVDAVFSLPGQDDLVLIVKRVEALSKFLSTEDGKSLLTAHDRAANILRIEEKKDNKQYTDEPSEQLIAAQGQPEERALLDAIFAMQKEADAALSKADFEAAMRALARLRAPVDKFFDKVTVNAKEPALRENRLKLLSLIRRSMSKIADFSKIEGGAK
ncbi:MAG: glycine--tRNA ligase subunit beta, partial [Alphaproteobacteria bacterium]